MGEPCDVCKRIHPGRCSPVEARSVKVCVTMPRWLLERLDRAVGAGGTRSGFLRRLVEREVTG